MSKYAGMAFALLLVSLLSVAQTQTITGHLLDDKGYPIAGATIKVKNTNRSTISDAAGHFSIEASETAILSITSIGFQQTEIRAGDPAIRQLRLEHAESSLDSVLVTTALGIKRTRNSLPYATQQVSAEDLNRTPNTNFLDNLSGLFGITSDNDDCCTPVRQC